MTDFPKLPLLIVKTGSTLSGLLRTSGDFEDWVRREMDHSQMDTRVVDVTRNETLPALSEISAAIVTGSHSMVTQHLDWSERTAEWLAEAVEKQIPVLGICYGHQLLAYALGGEVHDNPYGHEYGTEMIRLNSDYTNDPLFRDLPEQFYAHVCHTQTVTALPAQAQVYGRSERDAHQAVRFAPVAWGVQFHPEFDAAGMRAYIEHDRSILLSEGQNVDDLLEAIQETPVSSSLLNRFSRLIYLESKAR